MITPDRFAQRLNALPTEIWTMLIEIDQLKGLWLGSASLSPHILGRLKRSVLITSTGASTRIEGSTMSDEDIEKMLRGISIQTLNNRDQQEVQGYYELLQNIFESWQNLSFNKSFILHCHQELLKYGEKDRYHRGKYKSSENKVHMVNEKGESIGILFDTTPAYLTPKEMLGLVEWTQQELGRKKYHPLLVIGNFIVEFLNIHPLTDGNGRLSRIITNYLMLTQDYGFIPYISHEKLIEDNKPEYYIALRSSQKTLKRKKEDMRPWLTFFLSVVLRQSQMAVQLLSQESIEQLLSIKQLAVWQFLQSVKESTPREIAQSTSVARPTVNQVLNKLLSLKKIERIGLGSATRYRKL